MIPRNENVVVQTGQGVLDQDAVLARTQQDAHRWLVAINHHVFPVPGDIGIELAEMLVPEFIHLQLDQHMTFQEAMVKHQVYEAVTITDEDALLARLEQESLAKLKQKGLDLVDNGSLKFVF